MAEITMVKHHLAAEFIDAGAVLTQKLDELGTPFTAAFWFFEVEEDEWKLIFASPEVSTLGPRKMYQVIQNAIREIEDANFPIHLNFTRVLDDNSKLVQSLRTVLKTGAVISRIRFSRDMANQMFIEDAIIYRI